MIRLSPILANVITADMGFLPGLALSPYRNRLTAIGIVVSLLAFALAFIVPAIGARRARRLEGER